jgi:hypothetical protein
LIYSLIFLENPFYQSICFQSHFGSIFLLTVEEQKSAASDKLRYQSEFLFLLKDRLLKAVHFFPDSFFSRQIKSFSFLFHSCLFKTELWVCCFALLASKSKQLLLTKPSLNPRKKSLQRFRQSPICFFSPLPRRWKTDRENICKNFPLICSRFQILFVWNSILESSSLNFIKCILCNILKCVLKHQRNNCLLVVQIYFQSICN